MSYEQGDLDLRAPFQRHSETSEEAAELIEPKAGTLRAKVLAFIRGRKREGATDEEIQHGTGMAQSTERPRRVLLWNMGLIVKTDRVWVAKEFAC